MARSTKNVTANVAAEFEIEKLTKNTVKFVEAKESDFSAPVIGTIYIPKTTLGQIGFSEGKKIRVTVEVI